MSNVVVRVPVILGTPTISYIVNMIREKEVDTLVMPWVNAWVAYLLAVLWATVTMEDKKAAAGKSDSSEYNEIVTTKDTRPLMPSHPTSYMQG